MQSIANDGFDSLGRRKSYSLLLEMKPKRELPYSWAGSYHMQQIGYLLEPEHVHWTIALSQFIYLSSSAPFSLFTFKLTFHHLAADWRMLTVMMLVKLAEALVVRSYSFRAVANGYRHTVQGRSSLQVVSEQHPSACHEIELALLTSKTVAKSQP